MQYNEAVSVFGETVTVDLSDRRFLLTVVDPELTSEDISIRLELSFLSDLSELQAGAEGGKFESVKTGRLSAGILHDWGVLSKTNAREFLQFCRNWRSSEYYKKGGQRQRAVFTQGTLEAHLVEFEGPSGVRCAGFTRPVISDGKLSFSGGPSQKGREFIQELLKTSPASSTRVDELLF